jgi:lipoprotein-releasing system ATP-binding protein
MDTDYEGQLLIHNELVTGQPDKNLARIRNEKILFFNFITYQNIMLGNVIPGFKLGKYSNEELEHRAIGHLKHWV